MIQAGHRVVQALWKHLRQKLSARTCAFVFVPPCYYIAERLGPGSFVLDLGTGPDADFSQALIARYGVRSVGFDPTPRHREALEILERTSGGRFTHFPIAVSDTTGRRTLFETQDNVSSSFSRGHVNVRNDRIREHEVETLTLGDALKKAGADAIDLVKMDIEGEEYNVISGLEPSVLQRIDQLIVEFHHHCIVGFSEQDTLAAVGRLRRTGFEVYTVDGINFLFFRPGGRHKKKATRHILQ